MRAHLRSLEQAIDETERCSARSMASASWSSISRGSGQAGQDRGSNLAMIDIELTPGEERTLRTPEVIRYLREGFRRFPVSTSSPSVPGNPARRARMSISA